MIKSSLLTAAVTAALFTTGSALAQAPQGQQMAPPPMGGPMEREMQRPRFTPPPPPQKLPMPEFPTPDELAEMAPPEPMTEEKIKERFTKRKAKIEEAMDRDRKAAEKYAKDYARLQQHQADSLADIMARAEKRRQAILKRIDDMEQMVLERFHKKKAAAAAAKTAPAPAK